MRILITGGAGFIGSHIVKSLVDKGEEVIIYDNFSTGLSDNLDDIKSDRIEIIEGDILDYHALSEATNNVDIISHHAAQLEIFVGVDEPERDLSVNTIGTLNVLKAAKNSNVKKVINASSACIYGQTDSLTKEDDPTDPNWAYGVSKLAAEKYANIYSKYKDLPVTNLRYGIVYGEKEWYRRVLPIFIKKILNNESPVVFSKGNQVRDFIYVGDIVDLHNICLYDSVANSETFNVGTGKPTTILELAKTACRLAEQDIEVTFEDLKEGEFSSLVEGKKRNIDELGVMLLNIDKAKNILGWEPKTSLIEGMKKEYDWAKDHLDRWDKIFSTKW
ncbi:NAD-dependent epimerase/dehydratase family protein [candidate division KSB1 bacterium]|nr:NAD-dependent epimerase/dehydratase family protein [candidate division KSB1 bacterium]MBL7105573.1 NAD-dependent epimerase/dehydratase family protein [Bacteroidales bacterium]